MGRPRPITLPKEMTNYILEEQRKFKIEFVHNNPENPFEVMGRVYQGGVLIVDSGKYRTTYPDHMESWASREIWKFKFSSYHTEYKHVYENDVIIKPEDFELEVEKYQWSCGDGCCSDSGYLGKVSYNGVTLWEWNDWVHNHDRDYFVSKMIDKIKDNTGITVAKKDLKINYIASEERDGEREYYEDY